MAYRDETQALRDRVASLEAEVKRLLGDHGDGEIRRHELEAQARVAEFRASTAEAERDALRAMKDTSEQVAEARANAARLVAQKQQERAQVELAGLQDELVLLRSFDPLAVLAHYRRRAEAARHAAAQAAPPGSADPVLTRVRESLEREAAARTAEVREVARRLTAAPATLRRAVLRCAVERCPDCARFVDALGADHEVLATDGRTWRVRPFPDDALRTIYGATEVAHACGVRMRRESDALVLDLP